jgi:hypothetical protein
MTSIFLSMPYKKQAQNGALKKDIDDSISTLIAQGYILNATQSLHLKNNQCTVYLIDRVKKRRAKGSLINMVPTGNFTKFGERNDIILSNLVEINFSPECFKVHRTGVKIIDNNGAYIE